MKELLEHNYHVIGTVRPSTKKDCNHYYDTIPILKKFPERLIVLENIDIMNEMDFYPLVKSVEGVFHIACPLPQEFDDPKKQMYDPAVLGTQSILRACVKDFSQVKRFIYMSSASAVRQVVNSPKLDYDHIYCENDWNSSSTLENDSYGFSKTQAERKAFEFVKKTENCPFDIISFCPTLVFGPVIHDVSTELNFSNLMLVEIIKKQKISKHRNLGSIDVRDISKFLRLAYENKECGMCRFLVTNPGGIYENQVVRILRNKFISKSSECENKKKKNLMMIPFTEHVKFFDGRSKDEEYSIVKPLKYELKNMKELLGMSESDLIPIERSIIDLFDSLIQRKYFK